MGERVRVSIGALHEATDRLVTVRDVLADLDGLGIDAEVLGDPGVASATVEVQRGWHLQRGALEQRLATLVGFVDAAVTAARRVDATVVTGRAG